MTTPTSASNALLTEQLGWTPLSLIDDVINSVNELLYSSVESVESFVLSQPPQVLGFTPLPGSIPDTDGDGNVLFSQNEEDELQRGIHRLETLLETAVDRNFDGFELYILRNVLVVKEDLVKWVQLAHHKGIEFPTSKNTQVENTIPAIEVQTRLRTLRQKLLSSHNLNHALKRENAANERTVSQLRVLVNSINSTTTTSGVAPYSLLGNANATKDAAEFTTSQLGLIRSMVEELKPKYIALSTQHADVNGANAEAVEMISPDDERKQYIEKMTRKYMEVSSGMRLNSRGEIVGGDFAIDGARKGSDEVQWLEEIATKVKGSS